MGQYWVAVNLDKKEYVHPHVIGSGLKLWEIIANHPGVGEALVILLAAMPEERGGGDLELSADDEEYNELAKRTIGRWVGDRVVLIGDYAENSDLPLAIRGDYDPAAKIYKFCDNKAAAFERYNDISLDVAAIIEHELKGKYEGEGWRKFNVKEEEW